MSAYRYLAALSVAALALLASGCLPDPGPFYPRPDDSTPGDAPLPGDGPGNLDTTNPLPDGPAPDGDVGLRPDTVPTPDGPSTPTIGQVYSQVIQPNCSCHMGGSPSAGLDMSDANTAYNSLVGQSARGAGPCAGRTLVVAGDSSSSVLYHKLMGGAQLCGNTMPRNSPQLGQNLIDLVKSWIDGGASQ